MKTKPILAPAEAKSIGTTDLLITMTSGIAGPEFLDVASLIVGRTAWHEPAPRPVVPEWVSTEPEFDGEALDGLPETIAISYMFEMVKNQQPDVYDLIMELRKYIPPLNKADYPRPADRQIKIWDDRNAKDGFRHNVAIINAKDSIAAKIDPVRRRLGLPKTVKFQEDDQTRRAYNYMMENMEVMASIIGGDFMRAPNKGAKVALPKTCDNRLAIEVRKALQR
jgi:hypothetical protein